MSRLLLRVNCLAPHSSSEWNPSSTANGSFHSDQWVDHSSAGRTRRAIAQKSESSHLVLPSCRRPAHDATMPVPVARASHDIYLLRLRSSSANLHNEPTSNTPSLSLHSHSFLVHLCFCFPVLLTRQSLVNRVSQTCQSVTQRTTTQSQQGPHTKTRSETTSRVSCPR